jgi:hypothetical protein
VSLAHGGGTPHRQVAIVEIDNHPKLAAVISPSFVPRP